MEFIFCKLPNDIKKYILLYDEHFIVRNGKIISIIPKTDYRYKLLNNITSTSYHIKKNDNTYVYRYFFQNFCNYFDGEIKNDEIIEIQLIENEDNIEYSFYIGRQYPKSINIEFGKKQIYHHIENVLEHCLHYTNFEFIRFEYIRR
jgi:hypothetical protein